MRSNLTQRILISVFLIVFGSRSSLAEADLSRVLITHQNENLFLNPISDNPLTCFFSDGDVRLGEIDTRNIEADKTLWVESEREILATKRDLETKIGRLELYVWLPYRLRQNLRKDKAKLREINEFLEECASFQPKDSERDSGDTIEEEFICAFEEHHNNDGIIKLAYEPSGLKWSTSDVSYSFVPDGTQWNTGPGKGLSKLYSTLEDIAGYKTGDKTRWKRWIAHGLQYWANETNINFHRVDDDGASFGQLGAQGDIRIAAVEDGGANAWAYQPGPRSGGDITLRVNLGTLSQDNFYKIWFIHMITHEAGHSLGLHHSKVFPSVMGGGSSGFLGLKPDDIAGVQSIYGIRERDEFDKSASNNSRSTATPLTIGSEGFEKRLDLTTFDDVDYLKISVPTGATSLTIAADARKLSLLAPMMVVLSSNGEELARARGDFGTVAEVELTGLTSGETLYLVVDGNDASNIEEVFRMGAYLLRVESASNPPPPENKAPVLSPIPTGSVREGLSFTFTVRASDPDTATSLLRFSLGSNPPSGASINSATGVVTYSAPYERGGHGSREVLIPVVVTDDTGLTDTELASVVVAEHHPYQNPNIAEDVDANGTVSPIDVLTIINHINNPFKPRNPPLQPGIRVIEYVDVDGDDTVGPLDVLQAINALNRRR